MKDPRWRATASAQLPSLNAQLKKSKKNPKLGVTQGGSSREYSGARVAAKGGTNMKREGPRKK